MAKATIGGGERSGCRLVIIGDVRIDIRTEIGSNLSSLDEDLFEKAPIRTDVAGTALNQGRAAAPLFSSVSVLAAVGDDLYKDAVTQAFASVDVAFFPFQVDVPNGTVLIVRDSDPSHPNGKRVLVSGTTAAPNYLSPSHIDTVRDVIGQADLLMLDGYSFNAEGTSEQACRLAADIARENGALVSFDVLPHDLDNRLETSALIDLLRPFDIIISNASTLVTPFCGPGAIDVDRKTVGSLLESITTELGPKILLLRFGRGNTEFSAVSIPECAPVIYETAYLQSSETRAFGDHLAMRELVYVMNKISERG